MAETVCPVYWLFGLPSAGKTALAHALCERLRAGGRVAVVLDDEELRAGLNQDLGASEHDRSENLRRAALVARNLSDQGAVVLAAFVTPKERDRVLLREILGDRLALIHVDCPLEVCMRRDVGGRYSKARRNEIAGLAGLQDPFELPLAPDMRVPTENLSVAQAAERILTAMRDRPARQAERAPVSARGAPAAMQPRPEDGLRRLEPGGPVSLPERPLAPVTAPAPEAPAADASAEGATPRKRRRGRFVEKPGFFSSPWRGSLVVGVAGAVLVWAWWMMHTSAERKRHRSRALAVNSGAVAKERKDGTAGADKDGGKPAGMAPAPVPRANLLEIPMLASSPARAGSGAPADSPETEPVKPGGIIEPPDAAVILQRALEDMTKFFKAATWEEKAAFVRDPDRVGPLMKEAYEKQKWKDPEPGSLASSLFQKNGRHELLNLIYASTVVDSPPVELHLVKQADNSWRLDWESYSGAGEMSWEEFAKQRPSRPVLLRARAQPDNYYNYEFEDFNKYICFRLDEPRRGGHVLFAYCEASSPLAGTLALLFKTAEVPAVTVRVAFPPQAQSNKCVRLADLVAEGWLVLEE